MSKHSAGGLLRMITRPHLWAPELAMRDGSLATGKQSRRLEGIPSGRTGARSGRTCDGEPRAGYCLDHTGIPGAVWIGKHQWMRLSYLGQEPAGLSKLMLDRLGVAVRKPDVIDAVPTNAPTEPTKAVQPVELELQRSRERHVHGAGKSPEKVETLLRAEAHEPPF
jgi:hypothetical protein